MSINTIKFAGSSMKNLQRGIDAIVHDISNLQSVAYKKNVVNFQNISNMYMGQQSYSGTAVASVSTDFSQGALRSTGIFSNLALKGQGFFTVQSGAGDVLFTRAGNFSVDGAGSLVDSSGNFVLSSGGGTINIPSDAQAVEINASGEINILRNGATSFELLDQVQLASFSNPDGLESQGGGTFKQSIASGEIQYSTALGANSNTASTEIISGAIEGSNVNLGAAMTDLIALQRSYQAVSKAATINNELTETTLGLAY